MLSGFILLACDGVLGAPDYHVEDAAQRVNGLIRLYGTGSPACNACLGAGTCGETFALCAEDAECSTLAACLLERPSPSSRVDCTVRLRPSPEAWSTHSELGTCYTRCVGACEGGNDFRCASAYTFSGEIPTSSIRLSQTLRFLLSPDKSAEGLNVSVCRPGMECEDPIATTTTDATGTYTAEVPIRTAPVSEAGFRGYRLVHGESGRLQPHRLHNSQPFLTDFHEQTGLVSEELGREVLPALGIGGELNFALLQIFDCRNIGAGGIFFELDSENARVEYVQATGVWGPGPTLASQEGAAVALGLEPRRYHEIRAVTTAGDVVARDRIYVPGDAFVLSGLFPRERE